MFDFTFTSEQEALRAKVRDFAEKEIKPKVRRMDDEQRIPGEIIAGLAELGLLGMTVPEEYGGMAADPVTVGMVAQEIARADISCSIPTYFLLQAAWGYILHKYGTEKAKQAVLPDVTAGKAFLGIAATEPHAGSDLANIKTVADKKNGGYALNGAKLHISGIREINEQFPAGGGYIILVKTDPDEGTRGMSLLYLPFKDRPGISSSLLEEWGRRGTSAGAFAMKDVEVEPHFLLGEEGRGFYMLMEGFDYARAIITLVSCGAAQSALERAMERIKERTVFGHSVGKFEGVQFKLAEHWSRLEAAELLAYKALWAYDRNMREGTPDRFEVTRLCAEAKMLGPPLAFEAINDAIQWHGAFGYTVKCPLELALKGVRSYYWAEGAVEILKIIVARELLGKEFTAYR
ncbi:MAG: acyl-CoA dehydrogenase family protein [Planctomycetota bacterium]|jgi:acyl-CoA dehydrogenase